MSLTFAETSAKLIPHHAKIGKGDFPNNYRITDTVYKGDASEPARQKEAKNFLQAIKTLTQDSRGTGGQVVPY